MPSIDLHFHSTYSDGLTPVSRLATQITEAGLTHCSLADHDTVAGVQKLQLSLGSGIVLIAATELTVLYRGREIHLLAYDFDLGEMASALSYRKELITRQKADEMSAGIKLFRKEGFWSPILTQSPANLSA